MALYDTRFGLGQNVVDYLNQSLPDVSGIRSLSQPPVSQPVIEDVGLTPEQMLLLRSNLIPQGYGDDGGNDGNTNNIIGDGSNLGINSLSDLSNITGVGNLGNFASYIMGGIPGLISSNIIGTGFNALNNAFGFTQAARDQKARDDAAARGAAKANMAEARAITDRINTGRIERGPNENSGGGGIGSSVGGGASPGSAGPGGSDTEGSF